MFLLNCLLRGCIFGLSGPLVSQMVGGAMAPLAPPVPTPMTNNFYMGLSHSYSTMLALSAQVSSIHGKALIVIKT